AALVVAVTTLLFVLAHPVVNHLRTAWWLERLGCRIDWQIDGTNWRQGGVTSVSGVSRSGIQIFGAELVDRDLHYLLDLRPVQSLTLAQSHPIPTTALPIPRGPHPPTHLHL